MGWWNKGLQLRQSIWYSGSCEGRQETRQPGDPGREDTCENWEIMPRVHLPGLQAAHSCTIVMHLAMSWDREVGKREGAIYPPNRRGCYQSYNLMALFYSVCLWRCFLCSSLNVYNTVSIILKYVYILIFYKLFLLFFIITKTINVECRKCIKETQNKSVNDPSSRDTPANIPSVNILYF